MTAPRFIGRHDQVEAYDRDWRATGDKLFCLTVRCEDGVHYVSSDPENPLTRDKARARRMEYWRWDGWLMIASVVALMRGHEVVPWKRPYWWILVPDGEARA